MRGEVWLSNPLKLGAHRGEKQDELYDDNSGCDKASSIGSITTDNSIQPGDATAADKGEFFAPL
jgi:hypothetical protein